MPGMTQIDCWRLAEGSVGQDYRTLLWGPSGTGKSHVSKLHNLHPGQVVYSVSLTDEMPASELRGFYAVVNGSMQWMDGPAIMAWRQGARLVIDEIDRASQDCLTFLLRITDDPRVAQLTLPTGETVRPQVRKPGDPGFSEHGSGFHVIASMNEEPDLHLDPPALRDRFPTCIHINKVHPGALADLPPDLRDAASKTILTNDPQRKISIRAWQEYARKRPLGAEFAAQSVFGKRAAEVLQALRVVAA